GEFSSFGAVGPMVTRAFASGRSPARQPAACSRPRQDTGRLGQDAAMVPPGATALTICTPAARTLTAGFQALTSALNSLPASPSTHTCSGGPPFYQLLFSYPAGPPARAPIAASCHPPITNGAMQSPSPST